LALPPLWFLIAGVAVSLPARYVHSTCPPTLTVVAHIYAVRNLTPFMTTRGRQSESFLQENFPATHHISCRNIPSRTEHPVMPPAPCPSAHPVSRQTSCRAQSIYRRVSSSRQTSYRAPNIYRRASSSRQTSGRLPSIHRHVFISRQTSCRVPSIHRRAYSWRQKSCRARRIQRHASSIAANIPLRAEHPATQHVSCRNIPSGTELSVSRRGSEVAPIIQPRRRHPARRRAFGCALSIPLRVQIM